MRKSVSTLVAGVALALISVLAFTFPSPAGAATPTTQSQAPSAACISAVSAEAVAGTKVTRGKKAVKKARKKVRKARKAAVKQQTVRSYKKVLKAKKKVHKAKQRLRAAKKAKRVAATARVKACAATTPGGPDKPPAVVPPVTPEAGAISQVLQIVLSGLGGSGLDLSKLDLAQVQAILDTLVPDLSVQLSSEELANIVAMLTNPVGSPAEVVAEFERVFGIVLPADALAALLDPATLGSAFDPATLVGLLTKIAEGVAAQFPGVGPLPTVTTSTVIATLAGLQALLNGEFLTGVVGEAGVAQLLAILDKIAAGTQLSDADVAVLKGLVDQFSDAQLLQLGEIGLLGAVVGGLLNGYRDLPGLASIPALGPVLTPLLGGLTGAVCTLLPILCP